MKNHSKSKYTFLWGDYQPHITIQVNIESVVKFPKFDWNNIKNILEVSRGNNISCFHSNEDLIKDRERGRLLLKKEYAKKLIKEVEKSIDEHWKMFKHLKEINFSKLSSVELFNWLAKIADEWSHIISYFRFSQAEGTFYLVEKIKKHLSPNELSLLMLSPELDAVNLEQIDWQKIVKKSFSEEEILSHAEKYPWLVMCHFTYKDVIKTLKQRYNYDKKHLVQKNIKKEKEELKVKQEKILKQHPEIRFLVELVQKVALSRMGVKSCWAGTDFYSIPLYGEIAKRTGEKVEELWKYYLVEEIKLILEKGKKLSKKEKEDRDMCFIGLLKNGRANYYSGRKAERVAEEELGDLYKIKFSNEFKGISANPGKVVGIARILEANNVEQTRFIRNNFKKGEILITQMTQPNIMDIASKAVALVTDEGGMLSHAAIISRELKIPCVVGTHFATKIIKDGDLVEVDANKGVVRVLKKIK